MTLFGILAHLLLEGRQVGQFAERSDHREQGVQFGHLRDMRLDEEDGLFRADADSQQVERQFVGVLLQVEGVSTVVSACRSTMQ